MISKTRGIERGPFAKKSHDLRLNYAGSLALYPVRKSQYYTVDDLRDLTVVLDDVKSLNKQRDYLESIQDYYSQYDNPIYYVLDFMGFNENFKETFDMSKMDFGTLENPRMSLTLHRDRTLYPSLHLHYDSNHPDLLHVTYYHAGEVYMVSQSHSYLELERDLQEISLAFADRGEAMPFDLTKGHATDSEYLKNRVQLDEAPEEQIQEAIARQTNEGIQLDLATMTLDLHGNVVCDVDTSAVRVDDSGKAFTASGPFTARDAEIRIKDIDALFAKINEFREQSAFIAEKGLQVFFETELKQQGVDLSKLIAAGFVDGDLINPQYEFDNPQATDGQNSFGSRIGFVVRPDDRTIQYFNKWKSDAVPSELLTVEDVKAAVRDFKATGERVGHPLEYS